MPIDSRIPEEMQTRPPVHILRTIVSVIRRFRLKLSKKAVVRTGACNRCGGCCRSMTLVFRDKPITSPERFDLMVREHPEFERLVPNGRTTRGELLFACTWLEHNNTCRDYENRLAVCRDYPGTDMYLSGAGALPGCGYRFVFARPFCDILEEKIARHSGNHYAGTIFVNRQESVKSTPNIRAKEH
ncbi:MAG: hypothetical protein GF418_13690 [Chitinivibrionales bacterium]|nr:hypothetical protein [Chitinivibrionales bacterium]MBD3396673.1 hypothetical protein [Chitinivibrionales bacterium]